MRRDASGAAVNSSGEAVRLCEASEEIILELANRKDVQIAFVSRSEYREDRSMPLLRLFQVIGDSAALEGSHEHGKLLCCS